MRPTHPLATVLGLALLSSLSARALATPPSPRPNLDDRGAALSRPASPTARTYAGDTYVLGNDTVHVVVSESDDASRPARWQAFDDAGRPLWSADFACPDFAGYAALFEVSDRGVCKVGRQIVAVDLSTGRESWRFSEARPLYITAGAQGRVAVSVANEQLAVLDATTGRELARLDVEGAVLESVAATPDGPLALLVQDSPGLRKDTIALPVGEHGSLDEIELSGDDPGRTLVAVPIGGPAAEPEQAQRVAPMKPLWRTPFEGYSFEVFPTAGAVISQPREGIRAAWDLATGALLWEEPMLDGELTIYGDDGEAFARPAPGSEGGWLIGARHAKTRKVLWQKRLAPEERPLALGQGDGDLGVVTAGGFQVLRFSDGKALAAQPIEDGSVFANLRTGAGSVLWITAHDDDRWLFLRPLRR